VNDARGGGSLTAACIVLDAVRSVGPAEITWDDRGRITGLRRTRADVADVCLVPGLVDAHCHLQIAALANAPRAFVPWASAVMAARGQDAPSAEVERTRRNAATLLGDGVTAVGDIDSTGRSLPALATTPLTGRVYRELTGYHLASADAVRLVRERTRPGSPALRTGLSPHAPYSVSAALFVAARRTRRPLAIHCAETPEERRFLRSGRGPFADLLASLGRLPAGHLAPGCSAVEWLGRCGVLTPRTALIHCQELERGDVARIAASGASIVVCPGTIAWFRREPPPVPRWLAAGIPVALGTDSHASTRVLSFAAELRLASRWWPELRTDQLLAMATGNGGAALAMPGLGRLRRGGRADFVVLRGGDAERVVGDFVRGGTTPLATYVAGRRVTGRAFRR